MKKMFENKAAWRKDYYKRNRDKVLADTKKYRDANPEKVKLANRKAQLKKYYGISCDDYARLFHEQDGQCAICKAPFDGVGNVDHNHKTEEVRGLLCSRCNKGLGHFRDDIETMKAAIAYLQDRNIIS